MIKLRRLCKEIADALPPANIQHQPKKQPSNTSVINQQAMDDAYLIAATLWGEARGEGKSGMQAILNVIMNRAGGDISKAAKAVVSPKQFSFWNKKPDPMKFAKTLADASRKGIKFKDAELFKSALSLVDQAMQKKLPDLTKGAKFYFNPKLAQPKWAKKMVKTASIGRHDFYKLPTKKA